MDCKIKKDEKYCKLIRKYGEAKSTCFLHNMQRPFNSKSLLQTFVKFILCFTNFPSSFEELDVKSSLDLIMDLFKLFASLPSPSLQEKLTCLWLEGT